MAYNLKSQLGLFLYSLLTFSSLLFASSSDDRPTVYEILPKFGLPIGLLPDTVKNYSLSPEGSFVVELDKPCYVQFEYSVYYEKRITGHLQVGSITHLDGIQVQRFLLWFDVDEIRVDLPPSDNIYFQVGLINKKLDVDQFQTVHSCRKKFSVPCGQSWKRIFELPAAPVDEIPMLITE